MQFPIIMIIIINNTEQQHTLNLTTMGEAKNI